MTGAEHFDSVAASMGSHASGGIEAFVNHTGRDKMQEVIENERDEAEAWKALESELGGDGSEPAAELNEPSPELAAEASAEPKPEAGGDGSEAGKPTQEQLASQYQAAMREERAKRQKVEAEVAEIREAIRQARESRQQPQAEALPSIDEDPVAFFEHQTRQLQTELEAIKGESQRERQERDQAQQYQTFLGSVASEEQRFAQQTPDYFEAADHLRNVRLNQLQAIYPSTPQGDQYAQSNGYASAEAMRVAHLESEVISYSQSAMQTGQSPAAVFYNLAKQNGYQGKQPAPTVTAEKKIQVARAGAQRSTSLSGGGSGGNSGNATANELAELYLSDPDAADKLFEKLAQSGQLG